MIAGAAVDTSEVLVPPVLGSAALVPPALGGCVQRWRGTSMGTTWEVLAAGPADLPWATLQRGIERTLDEVVATMSPWEPTSDIGRHARAAAGAWVTLSPLCAEVLGSACALAARSGGAFDPTVGAAVDRWGFGPPVAAPEVAAATTASFDWTALQFDPPTRRVRQPGGVRLDLCGIAKGEAVDRVSAYLDACGLTDHLVEVGGELRGRGLKPDGQPWWVQVEAPPDLPVSADCLVALHEVAIATSGDYRRGRVDDGDGARLSHTIDPRTGRPVRHGLAAATVLHQRCREADALATVLMVLGAEAGLAWADEHDLAARLVQRGPHGTAQVLRSRAWQRWAG